MPSKSSEIKLALALIVVGVIGLVAYRSRLFIPASVYNVSGQVVETSLVDSTVKINTTHVFKDGSITPVDNAQSEILVRTGANTKFVGTILHRPSTEELAKTKGVWDMKTVKKEIVSGKLSDLSKGNSILVKISTNNPEGGVFVASEVDYLEIVD